MKEYFKCQLVCLSYSRKLAQATYLKNKLRQSKFIFHSTNDHHFFTIVFLHKLCITQSQMSSEKCNTFFTCISHPFSPLSPHKYNYRLDVHLVILILVLYIRDEAIKPTILMAFRVAEHVGSMTDANRKSLPWFLQQNQFLLKPALLHPPYSVTQLFPPLPCPYHLSCSCYQECPHRQTVNLWIQHFFSCGHILNRSHRLRAPDFFLQRHCQLCCSEDCKQVHCISQYIVGKINIPFAALLLEPLVVTHFGSI